MAPDEKEVSMTESLGCVGKVFEIISCFAGIKGLGFPTFWPIFMPIVVAAVKK